jgi:hypothetical protein
MSTIERPAALLHIRSSLGGGCTTYLCGVPWERVIAAVSVEAVHRFAVEIFCSTCLERWREQWPQTDVQ